jgi:hypothetical protein
LTYFTLVPHECIQHKNYLMHVLKVEVLECEMCLHNAGGLHPGPQHILLRGYIVRL